MNTVSDLIYEILIKKKIDLKNKIYYYIEGFDKNTRLSEININTIYLKHVLSNVDIIVKLIFNIPELKFLSISK